MNGELQEPPPELLDSGSRNITGAFTPKLTPEQERAEAEARAEHVAKVKAEKEKQTVKLAEAGVAILPPRTTRLGHGTVWMVLAWGYDDQYPIAVFTTKAKAQAAMRAMNRMDRVAHRGSRQLSVEQYPLDRLAEVFL